MRIFYASDNSPNASIQSDLWRNNLYCSLVDLGHEVVEFKYDLSETFQKLDKEDPIQAQFIAQNRPKVTDALLTQLRVAQIEKPVELFFSYFYDACVLPEAIGEIRAMEIKTVNWYCNGSYQLHLVSEISPHYDWCLVPEKFRLKDYLAMGARPIYCQEAANPNIYKPYDVPVDHDVSFIGQAYGERPAILRYLLNQGIDVHIWGFGWRRDYLQAETKETVAPFGLPARPNKLARAAYIARRLATIDGWRAAARRATGRPTVAPPANPLESLSYPITFPDSVLGDVLSDSEMIQMYSRSKINLGFSSCGETHASDQRILQVRLRDFEVPMSGGFYMVEYMEELEEFYDIGKEIVCYHDPADLLDKIKFYLRNDGERERIRRAGYERCLRDHTWQQRFKHAFEQMGLS